jgi:uncharacterized protein
MTIISTARRSSPDSSQPVFVDTAAWIGLIDRSDALHAPAKLVLAALQRERAILVTTELVLIEVANSLATPPIRGKVVTFVEGLRSNERVRVLSDDPTLLSEAWRLFGQRPDKSWSLTDCLSFVLMARDRITRAFTSDHHFEQAGFVRLLFPDQ